MNGMLQQLPNILFCFIVVEVVGVFWLFLFLFSLFCWLCLCIILFNFVLVCFYFLVFVCLFFVVAFAYGFFGGFFCFLGLVRWWVFLLFFLCGWFFFVGGVLVCFVLFK